jgi:hypothetical protein
MNPRKIRIPPARLLAEEAFKMNDLPSVATIATGRASKSQRYQRLKSIF